MANRRTLASAVLSTRAKERFVIIRAGLLAAALCLSAGLALAQPLPSLPAPSPAPLHKDDPFGEDTTLPERTIIYFRGSAKWEAALESLVDAFASLLQYTEPKGIKPTGPALTVFTQTNDTGFEFLAALPIGEAPADPPKGDIGIGKTPTGRALKFTHRGSYDAMDTTYEAITNYLDQKNLDAKDTFIEEYASGPLKKGDDELVVTVYVPVK
jgi:effector-binding domain-containing protein